MPCSSRDGAVRTLLTSAAESSGTILSTNGSADAIDAMANATISGRIWPQQVGRGQHIGEHSLNACRKCSLPLQSESLDSLSKISAFTFGQGRDLGARFGVTGRPDGVHVGCCPSLPLSALGTHCYARRSVARSLHRAFGYEKHT